MTDDEELALRRVGAFQRLEKCLGEPPAPPEPCPSCGAIVTNPKVAGAVCGTERTEPVNQAALYRFPNRHCPYRQRTT